MIYRDQIGSIHEGHIGAGNSIAYNIYNSDAAIAMGLCCSYVLSQLRTQTSQIGDGIKGVKQ
jgi:hypothetical protein